MTYLLATYWLPLLLALALGAAVGFFTFSHPARRWWPQSWPNWCKLLGGLFVIGVVVAWLALLPGYAGHYLETALLLLAAYFIGCLAGSWIASLAGAAEPSQLKPATAAATPASAAVATAPAPAAPASAPVTAIAEANEDDHSTEANHPGARPASATQSGAPDDLKIISGIGPKNEMLLHRLGIFYFRQIAEWNDDNISWVNSYLKFKGRIEREDWVGQAKRLARGEKL
jgi:predicted flap endonuclease-1-like 5' DNA nuclease